MKPKKGTSKTPPPPAPEAVHVQSDQQQVVYLDPSTLALGSNVRYKLKPSQIEAMADSIVKEGGIKTTCEVRPLTPEEQALPEFEGIQYVVVTGNYRTAAAKKLNEEHNAGVMVPAFVRQFATKLDITMRQLSENNNRENMSPMDNAYAIKELLDQGLPKVRIREIFSRPGGKKGTEMQAASNGWVNIHLSFLDFPAHIRERIHDGRIGVAGAYELSKKPQDKWAAIVKGIEDKRLADIAKEEKEDELIQDREKRDAEKEAKEKERAAKDEKTKLELENAKKLVAESEVSAKIATETAATAYNGHRKVSGNPKASKDEKAEADRIWKDAEGARKQADSTHAANVKTLEKLEQARANAEKLARERNERLEKSRKDAADRRAAAIPAAPIGAAEVNQAAAAVESGVQTAVKLNAALIRDAVQTIKSLAGIVQPKAMKITEVFEMVFDGKLTPAQGHLALSKLTGEYHEPAQRGQAAAPPTSGPNQMRNRPPAPAAPPPPPGSPRAAKA